MDLPLILWGVTCSLPVLGLARAVHANRKQSAQKLGSKPRL